MSKVELSFIKKLDDLLGYVDKLDAGQKIECLSAMLDYAIIQKKPSKQFLSRIF